MSEPAETFGTAFWGDADETEALQRYRSLVSTIDDGIYRVDTDGRLVAVNDALVEMSGYEREELIGEHLSVLLGDGSSTIERETERLRTNPSDRGELLECAIETAEGEPVRCEIRASLCDAEDAVDGSVGVVRDVTGRARTASESDKRGERERAIEHQRVVDALEAAREGISLLDDDGEFVYVNDAYAETFGYDPGEVIGIHWDDLGFEANPDTFYDEVLPDIAENGQWTGTTTCVRDDSSTFLGQHSLTRTEDDELICVVRDVTEHRRAQRRLEEERDMFAQGPAIVFRWSPDEEDGWPVEYVSENVEDVLGYAPRELESGTVPYSDLLLDEELDRIAREVEENSDETTERFSHEPYRIKTKDGDVRWVKDTTKIVRDETGDITNYLGYLVDITERKERERELAESKRRYRALVEHFPNGAVALVDEDLRYQTVGGNPVDVADVTADEVVERPVREALSDELADELVPCYEDALEGESSAFEAELENGVFEFQVVPIRDEGGEVFAALGMSQDVTERKDRERELAKYETIVETMNDGIYVKDEDGYFTMINEAYAELTGYDREQLLGAHASLVVDEETIEQSRERQAEMTAEELASSAMEAMIQTADGGDVPTEGTFSTLQTGDGEQDEVGVVRDITERKERERELERVLDLLERTERIADVGGWEIDPETQDVFWTDHVFELLEVSDDEEPPLDEALDMYHEEDKPIVEGAVEEALATGEPFDVEVRLRTAASDEVRWLRLQGAPETVDGDVVSFRGAAQDVTDRIQRERALQGSKNQLQALIDVLPVAVFVAEADGELVEWNEAAEEIWGGEVVESDSVAEYDRYDGWWADTGEPVEPDEWALARALRGEEVTDPDVIEIEGFDGERRTVLNHGMPVRDADGEAVRAVVTLIDITERNEYQRKLEASNERLEQFAYAASHDLQEPLRMVSSYLRLIEQRYTDELDEDGQEFIEFAVDGADRMRDMIEGLLKYSRVDTNGSPFEPVDLDSVLADVREDLQVAIDESEAEITASSLPQVTGDEGQLRQLFQNLLDNAVEYSGDDPPRVHVGAERTGSEWRVSFRDEGIGIDPGDSDRVFEVFQSLHAPDDYSGTGIGLALCERIVERHGGDIWVDSDPGEGSTFTFTLPAKAENSE